MEQEWCPPNLEVFKLMPDVFQVHVMRIYQALGSPTVSSNNFWTVYSLLCGEFKKDTCIDDLRMQEVLDNQQNFNPLQSPVDIPVLPGLAPLCNDQYFLGDGSDVYIGGAPQDMGFTGRNGECIFVEFGDEE